MCVTLTESLPLLLPKGVGLYFVREHYVIVMKLWPEVVKTIGYREVILHVIYIEGMVLFVCF